MKRLYGIRRLQAPRDNLASDVGFFLHVMMSRLLRILGVQHAQTENHAHHYLQSIAISEQSVQFHGIPSERHGGTIDFYENRMDSHEAILTSLQERVDALHGLVEKLELRTARIEQEYVMITAALKRLEGRFDAFEAQILNERIAALESRVSALESARS